VGSWESTGSARPFPIILSYPTTLDLQAEEHRDGILRDFGSGRVLRPFADAVDAQFYDIVPASLFSTVEAVKDAEGSIDTNLLQNLQKLPAIAESMPDVIKGVGVIRSLVTDRDLSSLRGLLDFVTSTNLQVDFTLRPYIDLVREVLPQLLQVLSRLSSFSEYSLGYGQYSFDFPSGTFGRDSVRLVVRTKLVVDFSLRGLLSPVLQLDALGVLPKPSNLWDLVPFSFLANWFTGVGGAMRRGEYSLLLAQVPASFVHTYTLTSPLTESELALYGYKTASDVAKLKLYYRDVSTINPAPRDSKFGFGIPTEIPFIGTLASLVYQLFL
jgi:hypothetical protein